MPSALACNAGERGSSSALDPRVQSVHRRGTYCVPCLPSSPGPRAHRIPTATREKRAEGACSTHGLLFATDDAVRSDGRDWPPPLPSFLPSSPPSSPQQPTAHSPPPCSAPHRINRAHERPAPARGDLPRPAARSPRRPRRTRGPIEHDTREKHPGARRGLVCSGRRASHQDTRGPGLAFQRSRAGTGREDLARGSTVRRMGHPRSRWCLSPSYRRGGGASDP